MLDPYPATNDLLTSCADGKSCFVKGPSARMKDYMHEVAKATINEPETECPKDDSESDTLPVTGDPSCPCANAHCDCTGARVVPCITFMETKIV